MNLIKRFSDMANDKHASQPSSESTSSTSDENPQSAAENLRFNLKQATQNIQQSFQNTQEEQEICRQHEIDNLMMLTCSMESNELQSEADGTYSSQPHNAFYFCSANALTIGYGIKIEYKNKKLAPEGEEVLQLLDLKNNGRSLSMEEKRNLVQACFDKRNQRDNTIAKGKKVPKLESPSGKTIEGDIRTCRLRPIAQQAVLFTKDNLATIDKENALAVTKWEYTKKLNKLLEKNPFLGDSYFLKALATDFAYQFGDTGVKKFKFYQSALDKKTVSALNFSDQTYKNEPDRCTIRQLLCKMAHKTDIDHQKRKGKPASPESQSQFFIEALKDYTAAFRKGILCREKQRIVCMEQFMTLTLMQCYRNVKGADLTSEDIKRAEQDARYLVYDQLFNSTIIQQLPEQIKPITIINAIENINVNNLKNNQSIEAVIQKSIDHSAQSNLKKYNEKHHTNYACTIPDNRLIIQQNER